MNALPAPLRRPRLLIVGCGDVGLRVVRLLAPRWQMLALTSSPGRVADLRAAGVTPLLGNLDDPASLRRLAGLADTVLHLAPPARTGLADTRTRALIAALQRGAAPACLIYASTTGVYGDCAGEAVTEARTPAPSSARAHRRADAEAVVRAWGRRQGVRVCVLRIPGIYALDRAGGDPRDRVRAGLPMLRAADDVFTNHVHADDLARACALALWRGLPQRAFNLCDDGRSLSGDWFDTIADAAGLARPPRITREQAQATLGAMRLSFLSESRQVDNGRAKTELRWRLRFPTVASALADERAQKSAPA